MKRNTNKILAATAMLLVSVIMLGTATYAWFAMNTRSVANGLTIEAYTDSNFLEISQTNVDADFKINTTFQDASGLLRLVTPKFFNTADMVSIEPEAATGEYTDTSIDYYKPAHSDKGADVNFNYLYANGELELASSTKGYVKNAVFELITTTEPKTGTFYALVKNQYVKQDAITNASAKGLYEVCFYTKQAAGATHDGRTTYYELKDDGSYAVANIVNFVVGQTDVSMYYIRTLGAPDVEGATSTYDGNSVYYQLVTIEENKQAYVKVGNLKAGSDLTGYYTLTVTDYSTDDHTASVEYYLKNKLDNGEYDYSYVGKNPDSVVGNFLYWGRAYSNDPEAVQENNTLNIIDESVDDEGKSDATNYYLHKTLYLRQAEGTNHASNLRVEDIRIGGATNELSNALRVLLVATSSTDPNTQVRVLYDAGEDKYNGSANSLVLFDTLLGNKAETITVQVYIYFDGMDEDANNKQVAGAVLNGQTVEIEFAIDELTYN